jgi:hypothetical protein
MTRSTAADPKIIDGNGYSSFTVYLFLIIIATATAGVLQAQTTAGGLDSTRNPGERLLSFFPAEKLSTQYGGLRFDLHEVELKYPLNSYQSFLNRSISDLTSNPFTIELRESSYYVPVRVRDELNLIMNRPRDSAFFPVLGVAWIAYQLGSKYLQIQQKNIIDHDQLLKAYPALPLLYSLWQKYPQTAGQLYHRSEIQQVMTFKQLQEKLDLLQQNNLIKSRYYSPDSVQYFPGLFRAGMIAILNSAEGKPDLPDDAKITLQAIRQSIPALK